MRFKTAADALREVNQLWLIAPFVVHPREHPAYRMYHSLLRELEHCRWLDSRRFATPGKGPRNSFANRNARFLNAMRGVEERITEMEQVIMFMLLQESD